MITGSITAKCCTAFCTSLSSDDVNFVDRPILCRLNLNRSETKIFRCRARRNATGNLWVYKQSSRCLSRAHSLLEVLKPSVVNHFTGSFERLPEDPYTKIVSNIDPDT